MEPLVYITMAVSSGVGAVVLTPSRVDSPIPTTLRNGWVAIQLKTILLEFWIEKLLKIQFTICDIHRLPIFELFIREENLEPKSCILLNWAPGS